MQRTGRVRRVVLAMGGALGTVSVVSAFAGTPTRISKARMVSLLVASPVERPAGAPKDSLAIGGLPSTAGLDSIIDSGGAASTASGGLSTMRPGEGAVRIRPPWVAPDSSEIAAHQQMARNRPAGRLTPSTRAAITAVEDQYRAQLHALAIQWRAAKQSGDRTQAALLEGRITTVLTLENSAILAALAPAPRTAR